MTDVMLLLNAVKLLCRKDATELDGMDRLLHSASTYLQGKQGSQGNDETAALFARLNSFVAIEAKQADLL